MWGLKVSQDRILAKNIVDLMLDKQISANYTFAKYGNDQFFLAHHVYKLIVKNSVIHDAYCCTKLDGTPWPTRRVGNCFVGSTSWCDEYLGSVVECPYECRPKEHKDWSQC